jgi:formylglycine-generating enzyme required for sulfatase activity
MESKPYRALLVSVVVVILAAAPLFGQAKRIALVIGNSAYAKIQALNNPVNDAADMTAALQRLGFTVLTKTDADRKTMRTVIDDFNEAIQGAEVALFYYSGHGVQLDNENYLVPVSAEVSVAGDVPDECVSLSRITARMNEAGAGTNIIILDACRDNPFKAVTRGIERGLAVIAQKPPESIIVYATAENEKAEDGGGRNGTFTSALLKNIERRESFIDILTDVNAQVRKETSEKQKPAMYASLSRRVYLAGSGSTPAPAVTPEKKPSLTVEKAYGSVTIEVRTGGTLYLNGTAMGQLMPGSSARLNDIEAGQASLEMRYADGKSETLTADVTKNAVTAVLFSYSASVERPKVPENMVFVEGGTFTMGSPNSERGRYDNEVQHQVTVSSFHMGKFDVTQGLYQSVMGSNPSYFQGDPNRPVEQVSWYDAVEFCNKLSQRNGLAQVYTINGTDVTADWSANGYRLPTEAEWEYAARGGQQGASEYHVYAGADDLSKVAWYSGNSGSTTHPVGQKAPNALGLCDMSGNVWQWCWDWWGDNSGSGQNDPRGASSGDSRVDRGGSWIDDAQYNRVAYRYDYTPATRGRYLGFRIVRP